MLTRIVKHLRAQWAGVLALFLVLTGGVAYAANTVFSTDIVDGEVKTADIGNNQIRTADLRDDSLAGGGLTGADIKEETLNAVQGRGTLLSNRLVFASSDPSRTLLELPGLGKLTAHCDGYASIRYSNTSGFPVDAWWDYDGSPVEGVIPPNPDPNAANEIVRSGNETGTTIALGRGDFGPRRIATVEVSVLKEHDNWPCGFQAQGHAVDE